MNFSLSDFKGVCIVKINTDNASQEITKEFKDLLTKLIEEKHYIKFLIDYTSVEFVDSAFLGAMVYAYRNIMVKQGGIKICGLNETLVLRFEITKLNNLFEIFSRREDALQSFN